MQLSSDGECFPPQLSHPSLSLFTFCHHFHLLHFQKFFPCFLFFILAANQKEAATVNMNCALKLTKFRQRIQHSFKPFIHLSIHRFITPSSPSPSTHGSQRDFYCAAAPLPVVLMRFQTLFPSLLKIENKYFHSLGVNWKNRTRNKSHSSPACIFTYFPLVLLLMTRVFFLNMHQTTHESS